jgi:hypothetical protein
MDQMNYIWRALARQDCQSSVETLYETVIAFPELLACQDDNIQEHLEKICELLFLNEPWRSKDGS